MTLRMLSTLLICGLAVCAQRSPAAAAVTSAVPPTPEPQAAAATGAQTADPDAEGALERFEAEAFWQGEVGDVSGIERERLPDGALLIKLGKRFRATSMVRVGADGQLVHSCSLPTCDR